MVEGRMILKKCEGVVVAAIELDLRLHTTLVRRVLDISQLLIDPTVEMPISYTLLPSPQDDQL
jgi:hypothetical protein